MIFFSSACFFLPDYGENGGCFSLISLLFWKREGNLFGLVEGEEMYVENSFDEHQLSFRSTGRLGSTHTIIRNS